MVRMDPRTGRGHHRHRGRAPSVRFAASAVE